MVVRRLIKVLCFVKYTERMPSMGCELTPDTITQPGGALARSLSTRKRPRREGDRERGQFHHPNETQSITAHLNQLWGQFRTGACPCGFRR